MEILAKRIKGLRKRKEMTQADLAELLHVDRATIAGYELNKREPSLEILLSLAKALNVSTDYLLGNEPENQE